MLPDDPLDETNTAPRKLVSGRDLVEHPLRRLGPGEWAADWNYEIRGRLEEWMARPRSLADWETTGYRVLFSTTPGPREVVLFWQRARRKLRSLPTERPQAWSFGATRAHADELLRLVLTGVKTATSSSVWDMEATGEQVPQPGELSIILDGAGMPRALLETTWVQILPFDRVDAEFAHDEGEDDRSLESWRKVHERYWRDHSADPRGFEPDMPVACERFRVLYQEPAET
jgi:uncharacterized protein YhfF